MTFLTRSLTEAGHRMENKHYFSVLYLTFDFESKDLKTLLRLTVHDLPAVNYLKVVVLWKAHEILHFVYEWVWVWVGGFGWLLPLLVQKSI